MKTVLINDMWSDIFVLATVSGLRSAGVASQALVFANAIAEPANRFDGAGRFSQLLPQSPNVGIDRAGVD